MWKFTWLVNRAQLLLLLTLLRLLLLGMNLMLWSGLSVCWMYSQQFSFCEWQNRKKFFNLAKGSDARLDFESFQISSLAHTHTHTHRRDKKTAFGQCQETETNGTMAQRKSIVDSAKNSLLSKHKSRKLISMPLSREMFFLVREKSTRRRFPLVSVVVVLLLMCVCVTKVRIEHRIEQFSSSDSIQSVAETT